MTERGRRLETLDAVARHAAFDVPFTLTHDVTHFYGYDGHGNVRFLTDAADGGTGTGGHITDRGRFWTMDEWLGTRWDPVSLHKYLYSSANPVRFLDLSGKFSLTEQMSSCSIVGTLARLAVPVFRAAFTVKCMAAVGLHYLGLKSYIELLKVPDSTQDKVKHCVLGCAVYKYCGGAVTCGLAAVGKEVFDYVMVLLGKKTVASVSVYDVAATVVGCGCGAISPSPECFSCCAVAYGVGILSLPP